MLGNNKKISMRQAVLLFLTITFTPSIRVLPVYAATKAKQAAWISPFIAVVVFLVLVFTWQGFYRKYKDENLMEIYSDIIGNLAGKIISLVYLIYMFILTALYVRYFAVRLAGSIYPNISLSFFIIPILIIIAYSLRKGITTLARFNEIALPLLVLVFIILIILMLPNFKPKFLFPISYRSIIPTIKGSIGVLGILSYFTLLFVIGDKINNKERVKTLGISVAIFLFIALFCIVAITLGTFSYSVVERTQLPFLIAVKQISLFDTIERIEAIVIAFWIISDYVLISFFIVSALNLFKFIFKLQNIKPLINIYLVFIYFLSMYIARSLFEMQSLSDNVFIPGNILLGFIIPIIIFCIGKLRKKV